MNEDIEKAFLAYKEFMALRTHFTVPEYDYFRYCGSLKSVNIDNFCKRKDKFSFFQLSKKKDYRDFLIANLIENPKLWIQQIASDSNCVKIYLDWKKIQESLTHNLKRDVGNLDIDILNNFRVTDPEELPVVCKKYQARQMTLEGLTLLSNVYKIIPYWENRIKETLFWPDLKFKIQKYYPFIKNHEPKLKEILNGRFCAIEKK